MLQRITKSGMDHGSSSCSRSSGLSKRTSSATSGTLRVSRQLLTSILFISLLCGLETADRLGADRSTLYPRTTLPTGVSLPVSQQSLRTPNPLRNPSLASISTHYSTQTHNGLPASSSRLDQAGPADFVFPREFYDLPVFQEPTRVDKRDPPPYAPLPRYNQRSLLQTVAQGPPAFPGAADPASAQPVTSSPPPPPPPPPPPSFIERNPLAPNGCFNSGQGNVGCGNSGSGNIGDNNLNNNNNGSNNAGASNEGNFNIGNGNHGDRNQGDRNVGDDNTGSGNVGNGNGGNFNSGNFNPGNNNTGIGNIGNDNVGINNTGSYNSGNRNAGNINVGEGNLGDCNVGNNNTGSFWTGNNNVGIGPAGNPKCYPGRGPLVPAGVGAPQGKDPALSTPPTSPQLTPATNPLLASPLPAPGPAGSGAPPPLSTLAPAAAPLQPPPIPPSTAPAPSLAPSPGALPPIGAYLGYPYPGVYGGYSAGSYGYGSQSAYGYGGYGRSGLGSSRARSPTAAPALAPAQVASQAAALAQLASLAAAVAEGQRISSAPAPTPLAAAPAIIRSSNGAPLPVIDIFDGPFFNSYNSLSPTPLSPDLVQRSPAEAQLASSQSPMTTSGSSSPSLPALPDLPRGGFPEATNDELQQSLVA
ncbi:hypothetical protein WJX74_002687 [Apatococcus lobatus]|uniref:Uncharacterized protein n=1 Tax=Apatococcus lobatus TaxID=904363 RepID=A0AAW1S3P5_9CHLO